MKPVTIRNEFNRRMNQFHLLSVAALVVLAVPAGARTWKEAGSDRTIEGEVDFPHSKKLPKEETEQNEKLAQEYKVGGFPTIILLSSKATKVSQTGYLDGGPEKYIEHLKGLLK